jgi:hypothetical protein
MWYNTPGKKIIMSRGSIIFRAFVGAELASPLLLPLAATPFSASRSPVAGELFYPPALPYPIGLPGPFFPSEMHLMQAHLPLSIFHLLIVINRGKFRHMAVVCGGTREGALIPGGSGMSSKQAQLRRGSPILCVLASGSSLHRSGIRFLFLCSRGARSSDATLQTSSFSSNPSPDIVLPYCVHH